MDSGESYELGLAMRREMFGANSTSGSPTELTAKVQDIVTRWCFGDVWQRQDLDRPSRSLVTVAMLLALGRPQELRLHMRGALANGVAPEQLRELCVHAVLYCGLPVANEGLRALTDVLAQAEPDSPLLEPVRDAGHEASSGAALTDQA